MVSPKLRVFTLHARWPILHASLDQPSLLPRWCQGMSMGLRVAVYRDFFGEMTIMKDPFLFLWFLPSNALDPYKMHSLLEMSQPATRPKLSRSLRDNPQLGRLLVWPICSCCSLYQELSIWAYTNDIKWSMSFLCWPAPPEPSLRFNLRATIKCTCKSKSHHEQIHQESNIEATAASHMLSHFSTCSQRG